MSKELTESWSKQMPERDGIYLCKGDWLDEEEDIVTYHFKSGRFFTPDGVRWVVYGGIWKRIGDLPPTAEKS